MHLSGPFTDLPQLQAVAFRGVVNVDKVGAASTSYMVPGTAGFLTALCCAQAGDRLWSGKQKNEIVAQADQILLLYLAGHVDRYRAGAGGCAASERTGQLGDKARRIDRVFSGRYSRHRWAG